MVAVATPPRTVAEPIERLEAALNAVASIAFGHLDAVAAIRADADPKADTRRLELIRRIGTARANLLMIETALTRHDRAAIGLGRQRRAEAEAHRGEFPAA